MNKSLITLLAVLLPCGLGCFRGGPSPGPRSERPDSIEHTSRLDPPKTENSSAEVSFETEKDRRFAEFVAKTSGAMVRKLAVGIDRDGIMRVQLGQSAAPEDTL